ncbi:NAD(P)-binding protein [Dactylosporangium sp. NPDC000521]|uniref:NAD(P)-binding protein n=1 Tax=Dactylosporangium sp. NPDC000521 TaxID=3363975 RepID=UPI00369C4DA6
MRRSPPRPGRPDPPPGHTAGARSLEHGLAFCGAITRNERGGSSMICVVGSGPAGVAAAVALTRQGHHVTILDAGLSLEPERQVSVGRMAGLAPAQWDARDVATVKENMASGASGVPLKVIFGSDFPYREAEQHLPRRATNVGLLPSFGKGGFGNVWGAAALPYLDDELGNWPIKPGELHPAFEGVLSFVGLSGADDDLAERFPPFTDRLEHLPASRQVDAFLGDLRRNKDELRRQGFLFGRARLAVASRNADGHACERCGLCMFGCPYGLIYNPARTLADLIGQQKVTYIPGVIVTRFTERDGEVHIEGRDRVTGEPVHHVASRLYVAGGVLSTTKLYLESIGAYDHEVVIRDSQYFLLPTLRYAGAPGVFDEGLHTLSQAFLEVFDPELSAKSIHLQLYTYNELYRDAIRATLRAAYPAFRPMSSAVLQRMLLIQGYLHSDLSGEIGLTLRRDGTLDLQGRRGPQTRRVLKKLAAKLRRNRSLLRTVPLSPAMKLGEPGRGFHSGGTLPMRQEPGDFETDPLGRPAGFERVHLVDSTVFPDIAASTITLTVMANAYRIGAHEEAGR